LDIYKMLEQLLDTTVEKPKKFGPIVWGLNTEDVAMQIAKIRASLPNEVKKAEHVNRDADRIVESAKDDARKELDSAKQAAYRQVSEAKAEAERVLQAARDERDRLVAENEILKLAKAQAEEIRSEAQREARELRRGADEYSYQVLGHLENVIGKASVVIERGRAELNAPETAAVEPRERLKV
jgi:vacuolar-type H+-ATPase subunit H